MMLKRSDKEKEQETEDEDHEEDGWWEVPSKM